MLIVLYFFYLCYREPGGLVVIYFAIDVIEDLDG